MEYLAYYTMPVSEREIQGRTYRGPNDFHELAEIYAFSVIYAEHTCLVLVYASRERHQALRNVPSVTLLALEAANALKRAFTGRTNQDPLPNMGVRVPAGLQWELLQPGD